MVNFLCASKVFKERKRTCYEVYWASWHYMCLLPWFNFQLSTPSLLIFASEHDVVSVTLTSRGSLFRIHCLYSLWGRRESSRINRPLSIYWNSGWKRGLEDKDKGKWLISFTFIATCFYCFCPLSLTIKQNTDIWKMAYWLLSSENNLFNAYMRQN